MEKIGIAKGFSQPKMSPQGGLVNRSINIGGIGLSNPQAEAQISAATSGASTAARIQAEKQQRELENAGFLKQTTALGKPLDELTFEDVYKTSGDLNFTKNFVDTRKAFSGKDDNRDNFVKASIGVINALINASTKIPSSGGSTLQNIYGKQVTSRLNSAKEFVGAMPQLEAYKTMTTLAAPLLIKAFGDTGNVPEGQIARVAPALENLASGSQSLRRESIKLLEGIFSSITGKPVKFGNIVPTKVKDLDNNQILDLIKGSLEQ